MPLTAAQLTALDQNQKGFEAKWKRATKDAVAAGFILPADGKKLQAVPAEVALIP